MRRVVSISVGLLFFCSAAAQEGLRVEGGFDCGVWAIARKEHQAQILEHYLLGLIDGLVLGMSIDLWRAGGAALDRDQANLWMDRFCASDIHRSLPQGALEFAYERIRSVSPRNEK